jgi:hypothetical protein
MREKVLCGLESKDIRLLLAGVSESSDKSVTTVTRIGSGVSAGQLERLETLKRNNFPRRRALVEGRSKEGESHETHEIRSRISGGLRQRGRG